MVIAFDPNILVSYYATKAGLTVNTSGSGTASVSSPVQRYAPTPPWNPQSSAPQESALVQSVLGGTPFINQNAAQLDLPGASDDYRSLFALYQGLNSLYGLADAAKQPGVSSYQQAQYAKTFAQGLTQVTSYINNLDLSQIRVTQGAVNTSTTTAGLPNQPTKYVTQVLHSGTVSDDVPAFDGAVQFSINVKKGQTNTVVPIDLSQMGSQTRSMGNVVSFINSQLQAAGVFTRFSTVRTPAPPQTITSGTTTATLPPGPDQWALAINTSPVEQVSFTAAQTSTAVYVTQNAGTAPSTATLPLGSTPAAQKAAAAGDQVTQLLKFQTDGTAPPQGELEQNYVPGRVASTDLDKAISSANATATGPDGSVYVLANVDNTTDGQTIKGTQDVALQKYDSAGNLVYSRDLGAGVSASGMALSVSSTGQVAIGGSVTGSLNAGEAVASATTTDSFVSLYDATGQEVWTQRRGASAADQVNALTFGSDGTVYVAGQTASTMPGATGSLGGTDGYLEAIATSTKGVASVKFTTQFGTAGNDVPAGITVSGTNVYVASVEQGHAVVRSFDASGTGAPPQTAIRDLGDLGGGNIAGVAVNADGNIVVGGSTHNALNAGTVTQAQAGGEDAFAAVLAPNLTASSGDTIAYYGGSGDDKATGMALSGDEVYLTGQAGTDLPGLPAVGKKDGFLAGLNVAAGTTDYSRRFTSKDGIDTPTSIAVAQNGASVLDQLGLPTGVINQAQSTRLIDNSSLRPGDTFYVKTSQGGTEMKVTIDAADTLDTLATKIQRASGFQVEVKTLTINGQRQLSVQPATPNSTIELVSGPAGHDALASLGFKAGVLRDTTVSSAGKVVSADGKGQVYGLTIDNNLNLNSTDAINHAAAQLSGALSTLIGAYTDMKTAATPQPKTPPTTNPSGTVPAYLSSQIANYQAGLDRLTGGGSSGGSSLSSLFT